jgi:hypothetical protein
VLGYWHVPIGHADCALTASRPGLLCGSAEDLPAVGRVFTVHSIAVRLGTAGLTGQRRARPGAGLDDGGSLCTPGGPFRSTMSPGARSRAGQVPLSVSRRCRACAGRGLPGRRVILRAGVSYDLKVVRRLDPEMARWGIGTYQ